MVAVISLALTILGLIAGLLPYSTLGRMVMSGQRPGTYWIMVVALLLISLIFFALGLWALKRYRSNVPAY